MLRKIARLVAGWAILQKPCEFLFRASLVGMNMGMGSHVGDSGERYVARFLKRSAKPIVFDVGANVGDYSYMMLSEVPNASIYAFEPSLPTYARLSKRLSGRVRAYNVGLSDVAGTGILYGNGDIGTESLYSRRLEHFGYEPMREQERIELTTIEDFCKREAIDRIDLLKLDIEGNEYRALLGAKGILPSIGMIQFEFGGTNIDSRVFFQDFFYLLTPTHRLHRIIRNGLYPIDHYRETSEIFVTTNFLAVRRGEIY
jgi:FkbM family methyltransferase